MRHHHDPSPRSLALMLFAVALAPLRGGEPPVTPAPSVEPRAAASSGFTQARLPLGNPVWFDLAVPQTYLHPMFVHQRFPNKIRTTLGDLKLGGDFQLYAMQLEWALTDRFALVACKDGYIDLNPDHLLSEESGWANLAAGVKYAFLLDPEEQMALAGRLIYEAPTGNSDVFQGTGDGAFIPSLQFLKLCDDGRWQTAAALGARIPIDSDEDSAMIFASAHVSYAVTPRFFPTVELNYYRTVDEGDGGRRFHSQVGGAVPAVVEFEGGDLISLGAKRADENPDALTLALGFRYRLSENVDIGAAYEFPLTEEEEGLLDSRISVDLVWRF